MTEIAIGIIVALLALIGVYRKGAQDQKRAADVSAQKRAIDAHSTRRRIEDDIQQDDDLYRRAFNSGIVRQPDQ